MCVPTEGGEYNVPKDLVFSFPTVSKNGERKIVEGIEFDEFGKMKMDKTIKELLKERKAVENMLI